MRRLRPPTLPKGKPRTDIDRINKVTEGSCQAIVNFVVGRMNEPVPEAYGDGIVMIAGGPVYLREAYCNISLIREMGCQLPIQIWHLNPEEAPERWRIKFAHLDVEFVDASMVAEQTFIRRLTGWTCKAFAVKHSPFRNVLLLDADCHPARLPEVMFDDWNYQGHGMVCFPDCQRNAPHERIFPCLGLRVGSVQEHENGLFMIDKVRNWKVVCLMKFFGDHSDFFYRMRHGEKDFWGLAAARLEVPFREGLAPRWADGFGSLEHYWMDGTLNHHHYIPRKRMGACPVPARHIELFREFES